MTTRGPEEPPEVLVVSVTRREAMALARKLGFRDPHTFDVSGLRGQLYGSRYSKAFIDARLKPGSPYRTLAVQDWWQCELLCPFPYEALEDGSWVEYVE